MVTGSKEQAVGIQFFQPTDMVKCNFASDFYKRFQAKTIEKEGFDLKPTWTWSINFQNGVGVDSQAPALAITTRGIEEGTIGEFGRQGYFRMEVIVINRQDIPDVEKVLLDLRYLRERSKLHLFGSLPNLDTFQTEFVSGLIAIAEIGQDKANTKGSVTKSLVRIPGAIEQWEAGDRDGRVYFMALPEADKIAELYFDFTVIKKASVG